MRFSISTIILFTCTFVLAVNAIPSPSSESHNEARDGINVYGVPFDESNCGKQQAKCVQVNDKSSCCGGLECQFRIVNGSESSICSPSNCRKQNEQCDDKSPCCRGLVCGYVTDPAVNASAIQICSPPPPESETSCRKQSQLCDGYTSHCCGGLVCGYVTDPNVNPNAVMVCAPPPTGPQITTPPPEPTTTAPAARPWPSTPRGCISCNFP